MQSPRDSKELEYSETYLITIYDRMEAEILQGMLLANDVPTVLKHRGAGGYMTIYMGKSNTGIDLYVPSGLEEKAKELIKMNNADSGIQDVDTEIEIDKYPKRKSFRIIGIILIVYLISVFAISLIKYLSVLLQSLN